MLKLLRVGHCCHPEAMVMRGHSWRSMQFPAIVGLLQHPTKGYILFDTGYAKRFLHETKPFPERFYRWLTPVHLCDKENLIHQLAHLNIAAEEITAIFISHFHADHIAGLLDFPKAQFICSKEALMSVEKLGRFRGLIKGYLPKLLPIDFAHRCLFIEEQKLVSLTNQYQPFLCGYDIFNDGSFLAIALPGHAAGQYGLLIESQGRPCFLIGDASWTKEAYELGVRPNLMTHLIMDNGQEYLETLDKLTRMFINHKEIQIIPAHCQRTFDDYNNALVHK